MLPVSRLMEGRHPLAANAGLDDFSSRSVRAQSLQTSGFLFEEGLMPYNYRRAKIQREKEGKYYYNEMSHAV